MPYYTPKDLATELGQTERHARRVMQENGIQHHRGTWWRLNPDNQEDALTIEQVRHTIRCGLGRYGAKRRPKTKWYSSLDQSLFDCI